MRTYLFVLCLASASMVGMASETTSQAETSKTTELAPAKAVAQRNRGACEDNRTGTRIRSSQRAPIGPSRCYTREDITRTGEVNLADALRKLDPSIF